MSYKVSRAIADKVAAAYNATANEGVYFEVSRANAENTLFNVVEYQRDHLGVAQQKGCVFVSAEIADAVEREFPVLKAEFPDFDVSTLPLIPPHFTETSWHNDACPSFMAFEEGETQIRIFIDYAKPEKRECHGGRFVVCVDTERGSEINESYDSWVEALDCVAAFSAKPASMGLKVKLAKVFGSEVQAALSRAEFREMTDANKAEPDDSDVCHTHDYCDANELMISAFKTVEGRNPVSASPRDAELINDAWAIAKAADFFA